MPPPLSGQGPTNPRFVRSSVSSNAPSTQMPPRQSAPSRPPIDRLSSTPDSRNGSGTAGTDVTVLNGSNVKVGGTSDSNSQAVRLARFTSSNSTSGGAGLLTASQAQSNAAAVAARRSGVLGCIGGGSGTKSSPGCSSPCDTVDCLTTLLTGNLLDLDAKKLLCDMASSTERALKRQIDATGNALLDAAQNLTSANALKAPLNTLSGFLNKMDPGAVAKCFGAQELINKANGQLKKVNNTISAAERGLHDKLADKFNKGTQALQQFSVTPNMCSNGQTATLRQLF